VVDLEIDDRLLELEAPAERAAALELVRRAAQGCHDCPLWEIGTQTVFGSGPVSASLLFIGEAPGAQEDKAGEPFVGPAGRLFADALAAAGLQRSELFITNVVKHRPWLAGPSGRQKNRPPKQSEVNACRQWWRREVALVRPRVIGCLGAQAAKEILGKTFRLTEQRGEWLSSAAAPHVLATLHPSYVLIQPDESRERLRQQFFDDIGAIAARARQLAG
jgi:DNA polymerase